jgi:hypothetical protein
MNTNNGMEKLPFVDFSTVTKTVVCIRAIRRYIPTNEAVNGIRLITPVSYCGTISYNGGGGRILRAVFWLTC